jgi:hypothetical protein
VTDQRFTRTGISFHFELPEREQERARGRKRTKEPLKRVTTKAREQSKPQSFTTTTSCSGMIWVHHLQPDDITHLYHAFKILESSLRPVGGRKHSTLFMGRKDLVHLHQSVLSPVSNVRPKRHMSFDDIHPSQGKKIYWDNS